MKDIASQQAVIHYYDRLGSRLGYRLVMRGSKHFGYYDAEHSTEKMAQVRFHEKLAELLQVKPGMRLLDAGSGLGVVATYLAKNHNVHVEGITLVPHELKSSKRRANKQGVGHKTTFQIADYARTPFSDASFDRIYTTETLSHAPDVTKVLNEFYRLLKPGGKLVCVEYEFDYGALTDKERSFLTVTAQRAGLHGLKQFNKGNFLKLLLKTNYRDITQHDWTSAALPSFYRIYRLARPVDKLVSHLGLGQYFVNTLAAKGYYQTARQGKFWFKAYTAKKHS